MKTFSGLKAVQHEKEYIPYLHWVKSVAPTSYIEIGVARGDTFHDTVSLMPYGSRAVAVDYPMKTWGLENSREYLERAADDLREKGYAIDLIFGDSMSFEVIERVRANDMFDLCFIDGDHTYQGVYADYDNYGLFSRYIAIHDIADHMRPNNRGEVIEVPIFWNEVKQNKRYLEFVDKDQKHPMGIGVLL